MTDEQAKRRRVLDAVLNSCPDLRFLERDPLGEPMIHEWIGGGPGGIIDFLARVVIEMGRRHAEVMKMTEGSIQELRTETSSLPTQEFPGGVYRAPMTKQPNAAPVSQRRDRSPWDDDED
jgi:hypothetical protein